MTNTTLTQLRHRILDAISGARPPERSAWTWPGIYLGEGKGGPVWSGPQHHALVIGPPRSGKTTSVVIPTVAAHDGPVLVTSTKHDVLHATIRRRRQLGTCWLWDPISTGPFPAGVEPLRWSPIQGCQRWDTAVARAWSLAAAARPGQQFTESAHWLERAQALLAPLLHAVALEGLDLAQLLGWLQRHELDPPLDILDEHHARFASNLLRGIERTDRRERSGIYSTADSILAAYRTDAALAAARASNFDPATFATGRHTVYICAPAAAQAHQAPLVVAFIHHIRDTINERPRPWPPVIWALDEVANIAPIPDLPNIVADSAAQGLLVLACLQDLSQARQRWGPAADGFLTLFATTLILPGIADLPTLQLVSALAGETEQRRTSVTRPPLFGTRTIHSETRPRLPVQAVAAGREGEAVLLRGGRLLRLRLAKGTGL